MSTPAQSPQRILGRREPSQLPDVLERVLDKGIVIAGDIQVNLLDIELLTIKLRLLVASVDKAKEMGIDWWENDPFLKRRPTTATSSRTGSARLEQKAGHRAALLRRVVTRAAWKRRGTSTASFRRTPPRRARRNDDGVASSRVELVTERGLAAIVGACRPRRVRRGAAAPQPRGPRVARADGGAPMTACSRTRSAPRRSFRSGSAPSSATRTACARCCASARSSSAKRSSACAATSSSASRSFSSTPRRARRRSRRAAASTSCRSSAHAMRLRPCRPKRSSRCARCTSTSPRSRTARARTRRSRRSSAGGASRCFSTPRISSGRDEQPEFIAAADDHADGRLEVVVTGPWPAYNFVERRGSRMSRDLPLEQQITLIELVDRVLNKGVVVSGDITLAVADVDLVYVGLRVLLASVGTMERLKEQAADALPLRLRPRSAQRRRTCPASAARLDARAARRGGGRRRRRSTARSSRRTRTCSRTRASSTRSRR